MPTPPTVFISYSHKDEAWKNRLVTHLGVLENQGLLQTWNDRNIGAGDEWLEEIRKGMDAAKVAVLLISANSLTSKFILHTEVPRLLERRENEGMVVFPVICKDSLWQEIPWLAKFQARPQEGKALASFRGNRIDTELAKIGKEILEIVRNGAPRPQPPNPADLPKLTTLAPLHQLPTPPADFTGRQEDLNFLRSKLAQGDTGAIFGLRGMGGVGKTSLALKFADELKPRFPDAQIYLDLKGVDPQPLTATQAMAHVIRAFHPETRLPESASDLAGLYRSVLDGKRALLLMDNAAKDKKEQIEPLIPPSTCLLLVTSRYRFALPGLIDRNLDEMSEKDARDLLLRIAPRIGDAADEIAHLCGGLPLALRLAGSTLAEREDLSPSDYIRRLKEGKERFGVVDASLDLSYELLDEGRRRLWRTLAVFPGTFDARAGAAIWGLEIDPALDALGELVRNSLVEWEMKKERYRLNDLARDFASRHLEAVEHDGAQKKHAEYFLEVLRGADDLYLQGGESSRQALQLFDAEWGNIQAGFSWASDYLLVDPTAAKICDDYPDAGSYTLGLRQHPREQIRWRELALSAARQRQHRAAEAVHLSSLGLAYSALGETRRAIALYEQALAIYPETENQQGKGNDLGNLGSAYSDIGQPRRAIELYQQALAIYREIGDRRGEGYALCNLGNAYQTLGETHRAIEFYEQDLVITREMGDQRGESNTSVNLGVAYAARGEPQRAIEIYGQALLLYRALGDRRGEGTVLGNLGIAYAALGQSSRSIDFYEQSLAIAHEIGDRRSEVNASWNLGEELAKRGELARAVDLKQICVEYEREIGHPDADEHASEVEALRARLAEQKP